MGQAWQDATVFDAVVLWHCGADMVKAFDRMTKLRSYVDDNFSGRDWNLAAAMVIEGKAGMQMMGDWAKDFAEANASGGLYGSMAHGHANPAAVKNAIYDVHFNGEYDSATAAKELASAVAAAKCIIGNHYDDHDFLHHHSIPLQRTEKWRQSMSGSVSQDNAIFRRILLPNSAPIIVVTVIWQFTNQWNDFLFGASFSGFGSTPMTVALNNLVNSSTGVKEYNVHFAGAILAACQRFSFTFLQANISCAALWQAPSKDNKNGISQNKKSSKILRSSRSFKSVSSILQIGELLDRKPSQLSGGQRQRVAMGRALVRDPQVFLFDEPLSNLDAKLRVDMRTEIKRLHARMGTTIVYVTHDQIEALTLATKIAVLKDGHLQQFGTPDEENVFVATFMGSPSMNLIDAVVVKKNKNIAIKIASSDSDKIELPVQNVPGLESYIGQNVLFGIRPEALTDKDGADRTATKIAHHDCMIEVVEPAGSDTFAVINLGGKEAIARLRADAKIEAG
ncbi:putative ABC transporter ATP-binding protein y4oS [Nymphon striatum]|nr:putative ABC transporter ATP-binding protein y4oS [Nymphon striatum]